MYTVAMIGGWEWVLIGAVVLLLFGARKLPELARAMGSSITQFKKGLKEEPEQLGEGKAKAKDEDARP
jgi:sec-independent protein translocase protein TatA